MVIKEKYPHAVSGIFSNADSASSTMRTLRDRLGFKPQQLSLVTPGDDQLARKVEPESRNIFRTLLSAHLWTAVGGLLLGAALALVLVAFGPNWARSNPFFTVLALGWVGGLGSLLIGGLITLRPDRNGVSIAAREASRDGKWTVIAHCRDLDEHDAALTQLDKESLSTHQSL